MELIHEYRDGGVASFIKHINGSVEEIYGKYYLVGKKPNLFFIYTIVPPCKATFILKSDKVNLN